MVACQFIKSFIFLSSLYIRLSFSTHVRGVASTRLSLYDSNKDFTCLDGLLTISFSSVNDDYCDCPDGTDEPGTSACPNGRFHCINAGFRPKYITSSRVNDAICDCCDGSDEYEGRVQCPNTCKQLYKDMYEQRKKDIELAKQGYIMKHEYSKQGQEKKETRKKKLEELKQQLEEKKTALETARVKKEEVEVTEKEAKEKHEKAWEETKTEILAERQREAAKAAFEALDTDNSGSVTLQEVVASKSLDKEYTEDEARELLGGYEETDLDSFVIDLWNSFKEKYKPPPKEKPVEEGAGQEEKPDDEGAGQEETPAEEATPESRELPSTESPPQPPPIDDTIDDDEDVPGIDGDEDDEDDEDSGEYDEVKEEAKGQTEATGATKDEESDDLKMPEYDDDTKAKMQVADDARKEFDEAERSKGDAERETSDLERVLNMNFGQEEEFAPLHGECYEYTDREYRYKLCPFDKVSQQPKDGGSETSLGTWGAWTGDPNVYSKMKYSGGQNCWNGPDRSAEVKITCGSTNELVGAAEPSRCEYSMEFKSPAACQNSDQMPHGHEEL